MSKKNLFILSFITGHSFNASLNVFFNHESNFSLFPITTFILSLYSLNLNCQNKILNNKHHLLMMSYFLLGLLTNSFILSIEYSTSIWYKIISLLMITILVIFIINMTNKLFFTKK